MRLWDSRDRLRPHREPEIHRVDLTAAALDVIAWGSDPREFEWFERPGDDRLAAALALLVRLGAVRDGVLTDAGRQMLRLPLHPRLARMLIAANGAWQMAQACAILSERHLLSGANGVDDVGSTVGDRSVGHASRTRAADGRVPRVRVQTRVGLESEFDALSLPGIPIAWRNAEDRNRRASCCPLAPVPRWHRKAG